MKWLPEMLSLPEDAEEGVMKEAVQRLADRPAPVELSQDSIDALGEVTEERFGLLVEKGVINAACKDALLLALTGTKEERKPYCLSMKVSDTERSVAMQVYDALVANAVKPEQGEQTGAQTDDTVALSMDADDDPEKIEDDKKAKAQQVKEECLSMLPEHLRGEAE